MPSDPDNPEWTEEDFARAKRGEHLPDWVKQAFPRTRRARKAVKKAQH